MLRALLLSYRSRLFTGVGYQVFGRERHIDSVLRETRRVQLSFFNSGRSFLIPEPDGHAYAAVN